MTATPEAQKGPSAAAAEKPPVVEMADLYLTAEAVRIAVPIVAEAGIADLLLEGPRSVSAVPAAVREAGATAWDLAHDTPIFEYLPAHPDEAMVFASAMTMFSGAEAAAVTDA